MLYITVTRSVSADPNTVITADFLNLLGTPIIEVKGTIDGAGSITLSDGAVTTQKLADASSEVTGVTNTKLAYMPTLTLKGNDGLSSLPPQDLSAAEVRTMLGLVPDATTVETSGSNLRIKDAGVTGAKLASLAVTAPKLDLRPPATITTTTGTLTVANNLCFNIEPASSAACSYQLAFAAATTGGDIAVDEGKTVTVRVKSPGGGGTTYSLAFTLSAGLTLRWKGGAAIIPSASAGQVDLIVFTRIGNNVYAAPSQSYTG
jgi:hypothetical protein